MGRKRIAELARRTGEKYRFGSSTLTTDVVRDIVLPETAERVCCYVLRLRS